MILDALEWLESHSRRQPLGEHEIRQYHKMICKDCDHAGIYRKHDILMEQSAVRRRPPQKVPSSMRELGLWLARVQRRFDEMGRPNEDDVLRTAVETHHKIGLIHAFADGNGRVARLSMNHLLRRYGLGYVVYPPLNESQEFWDALQEAHHGMLDPLVIVAKKHLYRV